MLKKGLIILLAMFCVVASITSVGFTALANATLTINSDINYKTSSVTISGNVTGLGSRVQIIVESPTGIVEYIGTVEVINGVYSVSFKLLKPEEDEYLVTAKTENMDITVTSAFTYDSSITYARTIRCLSEGVVNFVIGANNVENMSSKTFEVFYDSVALAPVDLTVGPVQGTDIVILESTAGYTRFVCTDNSLTTGLVHTIKFNANTTTTVTVKILKGKV